MAGMTMNTTEENHFHGNVAVKAVMVAPTGKVLICRNHHDETTWDLPGGTTNDDEDPKDALVREVREEFGALVVVGRPLAVDSFIKPLTGGQTIVILFEVLYPTEEKHFELQEAEIAEMRWVSLEDLATVEMFPEYKKALEAYFGA
jgi:8-oxo-dGTP diphosphatase